MYNILPKTLFLGKSLIYLPTCHSTNDTARGLLQKEPLPVEGTVVVTSEQTAGRGQRGNSWEAEAGKNLTCSVILSPRFVSIHQQFGLNIITTLAVTSALKKFFPHEGICIKWPNDIFINSKKVCGILIENTIKQNSIRHSIVGIGLNINQEVFTSPRAVSLKMLLSSPVSIELVLETVLEQLEFYYLKLKDQKEIALLEEYHNLLYWRNEIRTFKTHTGYFEGMLLGINEDGLLAIEVEHERRLFNFKEIEFIK